MEVSREVERGEHRTLVIPSGAEDESWSARAVKGQDSSLLLFFEDVNSLTSAGGQTDFGFEDLLVLQSHEDDMEPRNRREWLKAANFLVNAMRR